MSHGDERDGELLDAAVAQIQVPLCIWCPTRRWKRRWTGNRCQWVIIHFARCCATRSRWHRRRADEYAIELLRFHGLLVGDYCEDDLVLHRKLMVL